jgi:hypothetical protein
MKETSVTGHLRDAARTLQTRVRNFFDAPIDGAAPPLELLQAALDELERHAQPFGRGTRTFPYTRVVVHVRQPEAGHAAIEAVFRQLETRLRERLAEIRCDAPSRLVTSVSLTDTASGEGPVIRVECSNEAEAAPPPAAADPRLSLRLTIVKGKCEQTDYTLTSPAIAIGRGTEPADVFGCMRRNDVAFLDVRDGVTETVARAHARLEFDPGLGAYMLFNESTTNPTFLRRGSRTIRLVPRDPRGVRVQPGDELQLGRALVKIADDGSQLERPEHR